MVGRRGRRDHQRDAGNRRNAVTNKLLSLMSQPSPGRGRPNPQTRMRRARSTSYRAACLRDGSVVGRRAEISRARQGSNRSTSNRRVPVRRPHAVGVARARRPGQHPVAERMPIQSHSSRRCASGARRKSRRRRPAPPPRARPTSRAATAAAACRCPRARRLRAARVGGDHLGRVADEQDVAERQRPAQVHVARDVVRHVLGVVDDAAGGSGLSIVERGMMHRNSTPVVAAFGSSADPLGVVSGTSPFGGSWYWRRPPGWQSGCRCYGHVRELAIDLLEDRVGRVRGRVVGDARDVDAVRSRRRHWPDCCRRAGAMGRIAGRASARPAMLFSLATVKSQAMYRLERWIPSPCSVEIRFSMCDRRVLDCRVGGVMPIPIDAEGVGGRDRSHCPTSFFKPRRATM